MRAVLGKRFARFGLTLLDGKTRFADFQPKHRQGGGHDRQGKFDFLGFTHSWGKSQRGRLVVSQFTARDRLARAAKSIWNWCKGNRHLPLTEQHRHLVRVIRGHCGYYGLTGNGKRVEQFRTAVVRSWHRWLGRRHRNGRLPWAKMTAFLTLLFYLFAPAAEGQGRPLDLRQLSETELRGTGCSDVGTSCTGGKVSATTLPTRPLADARPCREHENGYCFCDQRAHCCNHPGAFRQCRSP